MEVTETNREGTPILRLKGRLDASSAPTFEEKLLSLIEAGHPTLALDFHELDYISSAGLRVLLVGAKKVKPLNGKVVLFALNEHVRQVFEVAGFCSLFLIHPGEEDALKSLQ